MRYTLKSDGYATFKKITQGRKWVGRVYKNVEGTYTGKIGATERTGGSELAAFESVVAAQLGYDSVAELDAHNRSVRAANKQRRNEVRAVADRVLRGDWDALDQLLGIKR
jgi:hypothetical protein